jgi:tRNA-modifying protein YgfZ
VSEVAIELDGQYRALREEAGFARLERGWINVAGADAAEYLQGQLTNDIEALPPGGGAYSALLDRKGRMQADMRVLRLSDDELLIETEPEARDACARHLTMYSVGREVTVTSLAETPAVISVVGPAAASLTGLPPLRTENDHDLGDLGGLAVRVVRTAWGLDLIAAPEHAEGLERALEERGVAPVSADALEILRVEGGRPRFGREMTQETIPQEAGINDRAVSFTKGCYIGQEPVARMYHRGRPNRRLRGLKMSAPMSPGEPVISGDKEVGRLATSVTSPRLGPIALAILRREVEAGDRLVVGEQTVTATVVELPFDD